MMKYNKSDQQIRKLSIKQHIPYLGIIISMLLYTMVITLKNSVASSIPPLINYQGMLTDAEGQPVANGLKTLTFNIYDTSTGGTVIWGPQVFQNVPVINGYFNVILGPTETNDAGVPLVGGNSILDAFAESARYLGVAVDGGVEVTPRQHVLSTPYAVQAETALNGVPPGTILPFAGNVSTTPVGYLYCNGSVVLRTNYSKLYEDVGISWGHGNGDDLTFNLPDLRGRFLRGVDAGAGNDPNVASRTSINTGGNSGDNVGSLQSDGFKAHTHSHSRRSGTDAHEFGPYRNIAHATITGTTGSTGGDETRPKNAAVNYIIKY